MKAKIFKPEIIVILFLISMAAELPAVAQHAFNNSISPYYRDGYLWNPALAGNQGARLYGVYNSAWAGFDGSAKFINLSADMPFAKRMGAGIKLVSYTSGILNQFSGALSYAYKIEMNNNTSLRIGGELSLYKAHLDTKETVYNGQVDPEASEFNEKGIRFNGDIGAYFNIKSFAIGATGYNLSNYFKNADNKESDLELGQILTSYRFQLTNQKLSLEPLLSYKLFSQTDDIFLAGLQFEYQGIFHTSLYWQSTGSVMGGLGFMLKDVAEINFFYGSKNKYGYHEQYEVGLKYTIK